MPCCSKFGGWTSVEHFFVVKRSSSPEVFLLMKGNPSEKGNVLTNNGFLHRGHQQPTAPIIERVYGTTEIENIIWHGKHNQSKQHQPTSISININEHQSTSIIQKTWVEQIEPGVPLVPRSSDRRLKNRQTHSRGATACRQRGDGGMAVGQLINGVHLVYTWRT